LYSVSTHVSGRSGAWDIARREEATMRAVDAGQTVAASPMSRPAAWTAANHQNLLKPPPGSSVDR